MARVATSLCLRVAAFVVMFLSVVSNNTFTIAFTDPHPHPVTCYCSHCPTSFPTFPAIPSPRQCIPHTPTPAPCALRRLMPPHTPHTIPTCPQPPAAAPPRTYIHTANLLFRPIHQPGAHGRGGIQCGRVVVLGVERGATKRRERARERECVCVRERERERERERLV